MDELPASAKRMPPNSTKTTPVKKLAVVKKRREGEVPGVRKGCLLHAGWTTQNMWTLESCVIQLFSVFSWCI